MRKKFKILIFSKMVPMILIKFSGFILYSKPNNMTPSAFPRKIPETKKIYLIFNPSPNVAPKPTGRSRSHSIPRVPLQISFVHFFVFDLPPKLRVVHIRKKINIFIFSKNGSNDFHKILWIYCTYEPQQYGSVGFSRKKNLVTRIIFFKIFYLSPNVALKVNDQSCSNSIFRVLL